MFPYSYRYPGSLWSTYLPRFLGTSPGYAGNVSGDLEDCGAITQYVVLILPHYLVKYSRWIKCQVGALTFDLLDDEPSKVIRFNIIIYIIRDIYNLASKTI